MAFIFTVVLKTFLTSLPLMVTRRMLETVPSEDQNNSLQAREVYFGKKKQNEKQNQKTNPTFARSHHCYTLLV